MKGMRRLGKDFANLNIFKRRDSKPAKSLNKKGAEGITLGTIFAIVLGLAVVVILIWGLSTDWRFLRAKSEGYVGTSNIDAVISGCQTACDTGANYEYCGATKTLKFGAEKNVTWKNNTVVPGLREIGGTCNLFANNFTDSGVGGVKVAQCQTIKC